MVYRAQTIVEYISLIPDIQQGPFRRIWEVLRKNLPSGFEERISLYGGPSFSVPFSLYPDGYHARPSEPLPFISLLAQKNYIGLYHMVLYADRELHAWFLDAYADLGIGKPDMGKSCLRIRKYHVLDALLPLLGELSGKITPAEWISLYKQAKGTGG